MHVQPSEIVRLIDALKFFYPSNIGRRDSLHKSQVPRVRAILTAIEGLPREILSLRGDDFITYLTCLEDIRASIADWAGDRVGHIKTSPRGDPDPFTALQRLLQKCPDSAPSHSESKSKEGKTMELSPSQQEVINSIAENLINEEWISYKKIWSKFRNKGPKNVGATIASLEPIYLDSQGEPTNRFFRPTLVGLVQSSMASRAFAVIELALLFLKKRFGDDPDFQSYKWGELKNGQPNWIENYSFSSSVIAIAGLYLGGGGTPGHVDYQWGVPKDIIELDSCENIGDFLRLRRSKPPRHSPPAAHVSAVRNRLDFHYDVALSFAGEDRAYIREVAKNLQARGVRVFFDEFEEDSLWGKNLYTHLDEVYRLRSRFCIMFVSQHYARKVWTNHERESAQARALNANLEYVLPVRFDDTSVPGLRPTTGYLDLRTKSVPEFVELVLRKLST
jgi:hypothetical protein